MTLEMLETLWCVFANVRPWIAGPAHPVVFVIPSRSRTRLIDPRDTIPPCGVGTSRRAGTVRL